MIMPLCLCSGETHSEEDPADGVGFWRVYRGPVQPDDQAGGDGEEGEQRGGSGGRPGQEAAADGGAGHQVWGEARHQVRRHYDI